MNQRQKQLNLRLSIPLRECNQQDRKTKLTREITRVLADVLGVADASQLDSDKGFFEQGMDSLLAVEFAKRLSQTLGVTLKPTLIFEHNDIQSVAKYIEQEYLNDMKIN